MVDDCVPVGAVFITARNTSVVRFTAFGAYSHAWPYPSAVGLAPFLALWHTVPCIPNSIHNTTKHVFLPLQVTCLAYIIKQRKNWNSVNKIKIHRCHIEIGVNKNA